MNKGSVLFKQVASVLGEERAVIELSTVLDKGVSIEWGGDLMTAFTWSTTPQDSKFWAKVIMGMNPYE